MGNFGSEPPVQTDKITAKSGAEFLIEKLKKRLSTFNYSHRLDRKRLPGD